jgi:hypothetical protein
LNKGAYLFSEKQLSIEKPIVMNHLHPILTRINPKEEVGEAEVPLAEVKEAKFPDELPILPLRGVVVYPQTAVPLTIG